MTRGLAAELIPYRKWSRAKPRPQDVEKAKARGFERLGCLAEHIFPTMIKEVWVDRPRTTQAHLHEGAYFFVTYFETGKCVITWSHETRMRSTDALVSQPTRGSFDADYDAHLAAVEILSCTEIPITVRDLDAALALGRIYYRLIVPRGLAVATIFWKLARLALLVLFVIGVFRACQSFEHTMMTAPP